MRDSFHCPCYVLASNVSLLKVHLCLCVCNWLQKRQRDHEIRFQWQIIAFDGEKMCVSMYFVQNTHKTYLSSYISREQSITLTLHNTTKSHVANDGSSQKRYTLTNPEVKRLI